VGTPFRPHGAPWRDSAVLAGLAQLWDAAAVKPGARLSQAWLGKAAGVATSTVNDWAKGKALPRGAAVVDALARVLAGGPGRLPRRFRYGSSWSRPTLACAQRGRPRVSW
jgi:hypothetical protein